MDANRNCLGPGIVLLCLSLLATFMHCDARKSLDLIGESENFKKLRTVKHTFLGQMMTQLNLAQPLDSYSSPNTQPYGVSSPFFSLPPLDSLPPVPITENAPPSCTYPPNTPQSPQLPNPSPAAMSPPNFPPLSPLPGPPEPPSNPSPSYSMPGPPESFPSPSGPVLNPPTPTGFIPSPPLFLPPVVFPPPTAPPPPHRGPSTALWCVAKPSVPDPIIQEAMNYACGSGADCNNIQPSGPCFKPDTLYAHASYAFNSYWQRSKVGGGTCEFGSVGMLVTVDPSYDGCQFEYF